MSGSVVLLGGPDSGKSNYIFRLWSALVERNGELVMTAQPDDISFVLEGAEHLLGGQFIQRSEHTEDRRDFVVTVASSATGKTADIVIPDISGELFKKAVTELEAPNHLIESLRDAYGALLFIREGSDQNVQPLDWVTSSKLLAKIGGADDEGLATQVVLCELIRFLELSLSQRPDGGRPRLSVIVSAWDLVGEDLSERGPQAYLAKEYPLLAGHLDDLDGLDVRIFGLSIVGGDLAEDAFREKFLDSGVDGSGWVAVQDVQRGTWSQVPDVTLPVAWAIGL